MQLPSFGQSSQTIRNTTGSKDPFAAAIKAAPSSAPALTMTGQTAKNTTQYPSFSTPSIAAPAAKAPTPAASPSSQPPAAQGSGSGGIYDLSTDPIVQKIQQLNTANYGQAVAGAQSSAKQDIINSGFNLADALKANPDLAGSISGSPIGDVLLDPATALAASQNPFSTAAGLLNTHTANDQTINQNDNNQNLYYSSTHGNNLGQEATNYLGSVSGAQNSLAGALSTILQGLTSEKQTEQQNLASTIETERENVIQNAISSGQVMLGYDSNGNPIFGNAPGSVTGAQTGSAGPAGAPANTGSLPAYSGSFTVPELTGAKPKPAPKPSKPVSGQTGKNSY